MAEKQESTFLGTGWTFPPTFRRGPNSLEMVSDEDDIQQSLQILLTTTIGERFLRPTYGCDLRKYLFEPMDAGVVAYVKDLVNSAILYHEPRIRLVDLKMHTDDNEGAMIIEVQYHVRATNTRNNFVFPFYKNEGTDLKQ